MDDNVKNAIGPREGQPANKLESPEDESKVNKNMLTKDVLVSALYDPTFWTLLFINLYSIYTIYVSHASLVSVFIIYWFQSIIIGIFAVIRILCLKNSVNNMSEPSGKTTSNIKGKNISNALALFIGHGIFHYFYYFLISGYGSTLGKINSSTFVSIFPIVIIFFLNHLFSFVYFFKEQTTNQDSDLIAKETIDRIGPMHISIGFIFVLGERLILPFLFLKTYYDVRGHILKHAKK